MAMSRWGKGGVSGSTTLGKEISAVEEERGLGGPGEEKNLKLMK